MFVKIILPSAFKRMIGIEDVIEVSGKSVGKCLSALCQQYPILEKDLFEKGRKLKKWVEIYVNTQSAYPEELVYPIKDGNEIWVILLIAGR